MNLRILKKLSKRAPPHMAHLGAMYFIMATIIHAEISIVNAINNSRRRQ